MSSPSIRPGHARGVPRPRLGPQAEAAMIAVDVGELAPGEMEAGFQIREP